MRPSEEICIRYTSHTGRVRRRERVEGESCLLRNCTGNHISKRETSFSFKLNNFEDTKVRAWRSSSASLSAFPSSRATPGCIRTQCLPLCSELLVLTSLSLVTEVPLFAGAHELGRRLEEVILAEWGFYICRQRLIYFLQSIC